MTPKKPQEVFVVWTERYAGMIYKVARAYATNDAADLVQEILLQLWRSMPQFHGRCSETTWIYRVAFFTALSWTRKNPKIQKADLDETHLAAPSNKEDPRIEELYRAIRQLKPIDRTLILLTLEQHTYQEIADITGLTTSNVGVRLKRAKETLLVKMKGEQDG